MLSLERWPSDRGADKSFSTVRITVPPSSQERTILVEFVERTSGTGILLGFQADREVKILRGDATTTHPK